MLKNYSLAVFDYQGNKLVDLSSHNISIPGEAYNINFHRKTSGYRELNFNVPAKIIDKDGNTIDNFRLDFLKNEYKVKVVRNNTEYNFIIKKVEKQRSSDGAIFYSVFCLDMAFSRLSKSGIDLYFADETGTAPELLAKVLESSDWSVGAVDEFEEDGEIKVRTLKGERSNRYSLIQELCTLFECFPVFHTDTKTVDLKREVGLDRGVQIRYKKNLKDITQILESDEVITKLWIEGGDNPEEGLTLIESENPTGENYILNFQYYRDLGLLTSEQSLAITEFEGNIKQVNQDINGLLNSLNTLALDKLMKESEKEGKDIAVISKKQSIDELNQKIAIEKNATVKQQLTNQRNTLQTEVNTLNTEISTLTSAINNLDIQITLAETNLSNRLNHKDQLNKDFELALGDFIHEGIYQNDNYVDSAALYKDALLVAEKMSYPRVSYESNVLDLSRLTGYGLEEFDVGDKVYIVDETLSINTYGRITEIDEILDSPQDTVIKISNYDTKVQDLINKIITASTIINSRKEIYDRAQGINADGTLDYDLLQKTFDSNAFQVKFGTNNSVVTDRLGITIKDLFDENKFTRINAGGIFITADGGQTWKIGMSADGISALNIVSGLLDTKQLQIWNSDSPKFFWNEDGIFAYGVTDEQWIRFNDDGLYFTRDNGITFDLVLNWAGLMIGNKTAQEVQDAVDKANANTNTILDIKQNGVDKVNTPNVYIDINSGLVIENGALTIKDVNNATIITPNGLKVMYIYTSSGDLNGWQKIGVWGTYGLVENNASYLTVDMPDNLLVERAMLYARSMPSYKTGWEDVPDGYYHARNLRLYVGAAGDDGVLDFPENSEYGIIFGGEGRYDITTSVWGGIWTPTGKGVRTKSGDITSHIKQGDLTHIIVESTDSPSVWANTRYSGAMQLEVVITGFLRG